jgi:hypothetical protein
MNEETIAAQLRESVAMPPEVVPRAAEPVPYTEPSASTAEMKLDDVMQYKLHEYFGEQYRSADEQNKQRIDFIYKSVSERIGTSEYGYVVAQIRNLEQMIGVARADNRLYKMYEWLRLDGSRRKIDAEMEAITG